MRQQCNDFKQHLNGVTSFPTAEPTVEADGVNVESGSLSRVAKVLVKVTIAGTGTAKVSIRGLDIVNTWGVVGENGGFVNLGATMAAGKTYYFFLRDVGVFKKFYAVASDVTLSPEVSVWFAAVMERGD